MEAELERVGAHRGRVGGKRDSVENRSVVAVLVTVLDVDGRAVDLTEERWAHIIGSEPHRAGHPELARHRAEVMRAAQAPDLRLPGRRPGEEWFYLERAGPSRFLKVVVAYHEGRGRVITAFARRSAP